jgi:hypothetical protein
MAVKTFTFRYDSEDDIGQWMAKQSKKGDSIDAVIRTIIGNYGFDDYRKIAPKQVALSNKNEEKIKNDVKVTADKSETTDSSVKNEVKKKPDDKKNNGESKADLGMFSSL